MNLEFGLEVLASRGNGNEGIIIEKLLQISLIINIFKQITKTIKETTKKEKEKT